MFLHAKLEVFVERECINDYFIVTIVNEIENCGIRIYYNLISRVIRSKNNRIFIVLPVNGSRDIRNVELTDVELTEA